MANNEKEIWRVHPDISGIEVSTFGNVRTLDRVVPKGNGTQFQKGQVLKQWDDRGYLQVRFRVNGKHISKLVHRLVAETFLSNPDNLPEVNHLDCDRTNNNVKNLEWCDRFYNQQYRNKFGVSNTETLGHPLFAINLATMEVSHFRSQREASREIGADSGSINNVIKGKYKYTRGYWFVNDDGHAIDVVKSKLHDVGGIGLKIK